MALNNKYKRRLRTRLALSQDNMCCYCHRPFTEDGPTMATIEHRKPKRDGGTDRVGNLAAACLHCNQHRGQQIELSRRARVRADGKVEG
jgi:5-methylcytosine-specific restriction endonuclease McrA